MFNRLSWVPAIPVLALACSLAPAVAQVSPSPSPAASASAAPASLPEDASVTARAKEWLKRLQTGNLDRTQLDATMNGLFTAEKTKEIAAQFSALGDPSSFVFQRGLTVNGSSVYIYTVTFKQGVANEVFSIDKDGKIDGFYLRPAQ